MLLCRSFLFLVQVLPMTQTPLGRPSRSQPCPNRPSGPVQSRRFCFSDHPISRSPDRPIWTPLPPGFVPIRPNLIPICPNAASEVHSPRRTSVGISALVDVKKLFITRKRRQPVGPYVLGFRISSTTPQCWYHSGN